MMTYANSSYSTTRLGTFTTRHPNALTSISNHSRPIVHRDEEVTLQDPYMMEAYKNYPRTYDFNKLEDYSRSYYTKAGHMESILSIDKSRRSLIPQDSSMAATIAHAEHYFNSLPRVTSLSFNSDLHLVPFESSSAAGYNLPGKKGDNDNHQSAINQAYATIRDCQRGRLQHQIENSVPDLAFTRTQLTKLTDKLKVRNVFGQSFAYILLEGLTASPLMNLFTTIDSFFFVGKDPRKAVPSLLQEYMLLAPKTMSIDWSKFDTSVEPWEINLAFDLLARIIDFPDDDSEDAFEFIRILFINRKIAAPDGHIYFKSRGVPSGSYFTMIIDSIVNWNRILYLHHKATGCFPTRCNTQGDDGILSALTGLTPEALAEHIPFDTDWILNPSKCAIGKSPSTIPFLQRKLKWGDFSRDVDKVERLAIYPEYPVDDPLISSYRARALWEDCNYESHILGFATQYLESKYGVPDPRSIPRKYKLWWQTLFETKK
jgi:hypothetical protein